MFKLKTGCLLVVYFYTTPTYWLYLTVIGTTESFLSVGVTSKIRFVIISAAGDLEFDNNNILEIFFVKILLII